MRSPRPASTLIAFLSFLVIAGCQTASTPPATTPAADETAMRHEETYRKLIDRVFNQGDTTMVDSLIVENPIEHQTLPPGIEPTRAGFKTMVGMYRTAFPDLKITVEEVMVDGDMLLGHTVMTGTNTGDFMGMKATGKAIRVEGFDRLRFEGDMMAEHWGVSDDAGMFRQLGVQAP